MQRSSLPSIKDWAFAKRVGVSDLIIDVGAFSAQIGYEEFRGANAIQHDFRNYVLVFDFVSSHSRNAELGEHLTIDVNYILKFGACRVHPHDDKRSVCRRTG